MLRPLRLIAFAFVTSALLACGQSQTAPSEDDQDPSVSSVHESLRQEALAGALLIVASYFQDDPEVFIGHLASDLPTLGGPRDWMMGKDEFSISVRAQVPFPAGLDLSQYTVEDYHQTFAPKVLTYQEAVSQAEVDKVHDDGWVPSQGEFFFIGSELQPGLDNSHRFLWDSLNIFVVGKRGDAWKLSGFVPESFVD